MKRRTFLKILGLSFLAPKVGIEAVERLSEPAHFDWKTNSVSWNVIIDKNISPGDIVALTGNRIHRANRNLIDNDIILGVMTPQGIIRHGPVEVNIR